MKSSGYRCRPKIKYKLLFKSISWNMKVIGSKYYHLKFINSCINTMDITKATIFDDVKVERKWRNCIVFPQVLYLLHLFPLTFYKRHREIMLFSCKASSRTYLDTRLHTHRHAGMFLKDMQRWKINYMTPTGQNHCNNSEREELWK